MKHMALGAAAVTALSIWSTSVLALAASDTWRGSILVTGVTAQCAQPGVPGKGQTLLAVFRPKMAAGEPNTALLITFQNGALLASTTSAAIPPPLTGTYIGDFIGGLAVYSRYTGGNYSFTITPSSITPTTPQISINGSITKFRNIVGCTLTYKGSFFLGV